MEMYSVGEDKLEIDEPPKYGLKLPLNYEFPLQSKQIVRPKPSHIFEMMPLTARYVCINFICLFLQTFS